MGNHMNPFGFVTRPAKTLYEAAVAPFQFVFVVGLCFFINWMTFGGYWWVKWVAFGMGIHWLVSWARAAKIILVVGVLAAVGYFIYKKYGAQAKARYDAWRKEGNVDEKGEVTPRKPEQAVQYYLETRATSNQVAPV
jgi:hypothetical protein